MHKRDIALKRDVTNFYAKILTLFGDLRLYIEKARLLALNNLVEIHR